MNRSSMLFPKSPFLKPLLPTSRLLVAIFWSSTVIGVVLGWVPPAVADPVVKLGTYNFDAGETSRSISIYGYDDPTSGPLNTPQGHGIQALNLNVTIANGQGHAANGGPVFHLGTPGQGFSPTNTGYVGPAAGLGSGANLVFNTVFQSLSYLGPTDGGASSSQNLSMGIALPSGVASLSTTPGLSLLATLYIDTIGVAPGTDWTLSIGQYFNAPSSLDYGAIPLNGPLDFGDQAYDTPFNTVLVDGIIHINVPEPASVVLAAFGLAGLAVLGWRRRKR